MVSLPHRLFLGFSSPKGLTQDVSQPSFNMPAAWAKFYYKYWGIVVMTGTTFFGASVRRFGFRSP